MRAKITQRISGEGDSLERNLAVKCSQGKNKRQDQQRTKDSNNTNKTNKTRQDYTGYPSESRKDEDKTKYTENYPGYPRSSQQRTRFKTGLFSKHRLW
jgi:hypothetical protein